MRAALAPLLSALLLAGCATQGAVEPAAVRSFCLEHGVRAEWIEPGAAAALLAAARERGVPVDTSMPGVALLPPEAWPSPDAAPLGVLWTPRGAEDEAPTLALVPADAPGRVLVRLTGASEPGRDARLAAAFLARLGWPDDARRAQLVAELAGGEGARREVETLFAPDVASLLAGLADAEAAPLHVGEMRVADEAWSVHLRLPVHAVREQVDGRTLTLRFDANDRFGASTTVADAAKAWPTLQARVRTLFERLDLPPPALEGATGGPDTC